MRLTLSYAALVVVAGVALFAVGFLLLRFVPEGNLSLIGGGWAPNRSNLLDVFVKYAWWATAGLVLFGLIGGWLLAGFVLRPLERMTKVTRRFRDGSLDERIALTGSRDEFTDLADAFDEMLARVQRNIAEERRFAANASHELRTPHAIIRTLVEVAQADPENRDVDTLLSRIGSTNERAIATTEALLALARIGRGRAIAQERVDLERNAVGATDDVRTDAATRGIRMDVSLRHVVVTADQTLVEHLVANLVRNAVSYNLEGGTVWVSVRPTVSGGGEIVVANTGDLIDPAHVVTLTEPFVRGVARARREGREGSGLGLTIVASIVRAHGGALNVSGRTEGGLMVRVELPSLTSV